MRRFSLAILVVPLVGWIFSCGKPISQYFARLDVRPDFHLVFSTRLSRAPNKGFFYFVFRTATGLIDIDDLRQDSGATTPTLLLFLETNRGQLLDRTVKSFQLMRGRFGTVYAEKTCFYNRPTESNWSYVLVHSYFNAPSTEVPTQLSHPPEKLPLLTSLSLVRVFRDIPEYLVVVANYEANGKLGSLHIDGAKNGDWVHSNFVPAAKDGFIQIPAKGRDLETLKRYGIPAHIDLQDYYRSRHITLPTASLPQEVTALNQHYGYNRFVRQDELDDGNVISSRFLQPSVTDEETALNPECESRFLQQQKLGLPTVE